MSTGESVSERAESEARIVSDQRCIEVRIARAAGGLGLSIAGGRGSTPYIGSDDGIFISRVTPNGPAYLAGLRVSTSHDWVPTSLKKRAAGKIVVALIYGNASMGIILIVLTMLRVV